MILLFKQAGSRGTGCFANNIYYLLYKKDQEINAI